MTLTLSSLLPLGILLLLSLLGTGLLARLLRNAQILDHPNERSSHSLPTPKGAGLLLIPLVIAAWSWWALGQDEAHIWPLLAAAAALCLISWRDDLKSLPAALRLGAQGLAVALGLYLLEPQGSVTQGLLPAPLDLAVAWLAWLWFVNLFNFMDGIDGIAGVEAVSIALGLALVWTLDLALGEGYALLLCAAVLGFLPWNWAPAKLFLGDSGSVPLGYLLGYLLVLAAYQGYWAPALILPAFYWADATITLLRRLARREPVWRAHRGHWYQRAAARAGHAAVALRVAAFNMAMVILALSTLYAGEWPPLLACAVLTLGFLAYLSHLARGGR